MNTNLQSTGTIKQQNDYPSSNSTIPRYQEEFRSRFPLYSRDFYVDLNNIKYKFGNIINLYVSSITFSNKINIDLILKSVYEISDRTCDNYYNPFIFVSNCSSKDNTKNSAFYCTTTSLINQLSLDRILEDFAHNREATYSIRIYYDIVYNKFTKNHNLSKVMTKDYFYSETNSSEYNENDKDIVHTQKLIDTIFLSINKNGLIRMTSEKGLIDSISIEFTADNYKNNTIFFDNCINGNREYYHYNGNSRVIYTPPGQPFNEENIQSVIKNNCGDIRNNND